MILEVGEGQADAVEAMFARGGMRRWIARTDLRGIVARSVAPRTR